MCVQCFFYDIFFSWTWLDSVDLMIYSYMTNDCGNGLVEKYNEKKNILVICDRISFWKKNVKEFVIEWQSNLCVCVCSCVWSSYILVPYFIDFHHFKDDNSELVTYHHFKNLLTCCWWIIWSNTFDGDDGRVWSAWLTMIHLHTKTYTHS